MTETIRDIREIGDLIQNFLEDGFTLECLSKATDTPIEWLEECISDKPPKEIKELRKLRCVFSFLVIMCDNKSYSLEISSFLKDLLDSSSEIYKIPKDAVGNYLGMSKEQFASFLKNPEEYPNGFQKAIEMQRMLLLFSIDKRGY